MAIVNIKGFNNNLVFVLTEGCYQDYIDFLNDKFESNRQLFKGSQVIFKGEGLIGLTTDELSSLQKLCLDYGMVLNNTDPITKERIPQKDIIIRKTVRSGQKLHSEGSLVIWGDVHESAEITASEDIIILGKLDGIAHAGCFGNLCSTIFALSMAPRQIRIGDKISRSPGNDAIGNYPEIAYVDGDNICIKEYKSRDNLFPK